MDSSIEKVHFLTEIENADFYISSLAIGVLEGMISGGVPLEAGIWSLARPIFWKALEESNLVSSRLVDWISSLDELDALDKSGGNAQKELNELIELLKISQENSLRNNPSLAISTTIQSE